MLTYRSTRINYGHNHIRTHYYMDTQMTSSKRQDPRENTNEKFKKRNFLK